MTSNKILVIFETSILRNPNYGYSEINFGTEFNSLREYILEKNLSANLAIPKFVLDELLFGRMTEFNKDIKILEKFQGLPGLSYKRFDYEQYYKGKLKFFLKKNNILVIPYPPKNNFYNITSRSLSKNKPFMPTNNHSDYGFKDVVVWESILRFSKISNFDKVIFVANDHGFDDSCVKEFSDIHDCYFKIVKDHVVVIEEMQESSDIEKIIAYGGGLTSIPEKVKDFVNLDYFKNSIYQFTVDYFHPQIVENFELSGVEVDFLEDNDNYEIITSIKVKVNEAATSLRVRSLLDDTLGLITHEPYE